MIEYYEKIIATLSDENVTELVRIVQRCAARRDAIKETAMETLLSGNFEKTDAQPGEKVTNDGREIIWIGTNAVVLKPEEHIRRRVLVTSAMEETKQSWNVATVHKPGESMTSVLCPACFCIMGKTVLCQSCAKSKEGFKILCTCSDCGHEVYL